jgi:Kef-type K+ transport system membrane component KefB
MAEIIIPTPLVLLMCAAALLSWATHPHSVLLAFLAGAGLAATLIFLYLKHLLKKLT